MPRPRKPKAVLKATGQYRKDRHAGRGLDVPSEYPPRPAKMDAKTRAEWDALRAVLEPLAIVTPQDAGALRRLAELRADFLRERDPRMRLAVAKECRLMESQFGLTPAAREKLCKPRSKAGKKAEDGPGRFFKVVGEGA